MAIFLIFNFSLMFNVVKCFCGFISIYHPWLIRRSPVLDFIKFLMYILTVGSMALVHKSCIEKWLSTANNDTCELCRHK